MTKFAHSTIGPSLNGHEEVKWLERLRTDKFHRLILSCQHCTTPYCEWSPWSYSSSCLLPRPAGPHPRLMMSLLPCCGLWSCVSWQRWSRSMPRRSRRPPVCCRRRMPRRSPTADGRGDGAAADSTVLDSSLPPTPCGGGCSSSPPAYRSRTWRPRWRRPRWPRSVLAAAVSTGGLWRGGCFSSTLQLAREE